MGVLSTLSGDVTCGASLERDDVSESWRGRCASRDSVGAILERGECLAFATVLLLDDDVTTASQFSLVGASSLAGAGGVTSSSMLLVWSEI